MKKILFTLLLATLSLGLANAQKVSTYAGTGTNGDNAGSGTGEPLSTLKLNQPYGLCQDSKGNIFMSFDGASGEGKIVMINKADGKAYARAGAYQQGGFYDAQGVTAKFAGLAGICVSKGDTVFICDANNHAIRILSPFKSIGTAQKVITISGGGVAPDGTNYGTSGYQDGIGIKALYNIPSGIAYDPTTKTIVIADKGNQIIRRLTCLSNGIQWKSSYVAGYPGGNPVTVDGNIDSTGGGGKFNVPVAVWVDATGDIYVLEEGNNAIRKVSGGKISTVVKFNDIPNLGFAAPQGFCKVGTDWYVTYGCKVVKITSSGKATIFAGQIGKYDEGRDSCGYTNGEAKNSTFNEAKGIMPLDAENFLVADKMNNVLRKVCFSSSCLVTSIDDENAITSTYKIYPNPATDVISIEALNTSGSSNIGLYDLTGRQVISEKTDFSSGTHQLHLDGIAKGMYILKIQSGAESFTGRVIINK
ncbi:MAG: T9SS type A sorting domain-containing protein [Bacteroidetes bacterium]|nr:T9SS type A sorting domain-containing protein [Bacteroidota bacterium]